MFKEAIDKILSLAVPTINTIDGLAYTDRPLTAVVEPALSKVSLLTLTGLVDLVKAGTDNLISDGWLLHVGSHLSVSLVKKQTDKYGRRVVLAAATCEDGQPFGFGKFMDREEFVIGLLSRFVQSSDLQEVVKMASALTASQVVLAEDDGVSQRTTVKQGIALKENVTVKGRVKLSPYRTFREVAQPESEFVFRLRSRDGGVPECALFEADGGKWKLDAVLIIKAWLEAQNLNIPVIA
jgi:hypothetical protein